MSWIKTRIRSRITGNVHQPQPLSRSIPHVVQKHVVVTRREQRIHLVSDVKSVLDELFTKGVIHQESYDKICALPTSEEKMMALLDGYVISDEDKDIFFNIVEKCIPLIHNQGPRFDGLSASADVQSAGGFRKVVKKCKVPEDHWIKLEPEGICLDEEDTLIYRDKVSLKYQFGSWEEQMERMEAMQFIPGGPLLDVTFIAGILDEAYLPHWICTEDNPDILGKFAVLHIDTCGDVVEQLSETNLAFLTLHVDLIPRDPALQQTIKSKELSNGYKMIKKPHPQKSLKMGKYFALKANMDSVEITPENLKLLYEDSDPNFFEVFIENPDSNFQLTLTHKSGPVWTCIIRKDD
ncbi:hypothetical protein PBY51_016119 [Eleginops maclovinus]|uniref:Uncharacterized protein n=1 Tax=Eleginops maclovinus TaxID=56733 RepID=A0AAN8AQJ6_ELEMC|nr:hypothetical protein PBY51_016119 [Eleginops maclovinus]